MKSWLTYMVLLCLLNGATFGAHPPSGGEVIKFENPFQEWRVSGARREVSELTGIKASNPLFKRTLQIEIKERTDRPYDLQLGGRINGGVFSVVKAGGAASG